MACYSLLKLPSWNSAIFTSTPLVAVPRAIVTSDWLASGSENWTDTDPLGRRDWWKYAPQYGAASHNTSLIYDMQPLAPTMERLSTKECIARQIDPLTASGGVIVVGRNMTSAEFNGSTLLDGWVSGWEQWASSSSWICSAYKVPGAHNQNRYCDATWAAEFADSWILNWHDIWRIEADHCLVGEQGNNRDKCGFHYSIHIWAIVTACTLFESLLVFLVYKMNRKNGISRDIKEGKRTMVTMGDAIQTFLRRPGWVNEEDDIGGFPGQDANIPGPIEMKRGSWVVTPRVRWFQAVSTPIWIFSYLW